MTSSRRHLPVVLAALTTLALAACTGGTPTSTASSAVPAGSPSATASPTRAAAAYRYVDLDLCTVTDLAPLAGLKLTLKEKKRSLPLGRNQGEGETCLHEFTTAGGDVARLTVEAVLAKTMAEAEVIFPVAARGMQSDGSLTGGWDQGEAATLNTLEGSKQTQYLVHLRSGNLYLRVWLAVNGDSYVAKDKLAGPAKAIAEQTYATVTRYWKA